MIKFEEALGTDDEGTSVYLLCSDACGLFYKKCWIPVPVSVVVNRFTSDPAFRTRFSVGIQNMVVVVKGGDFKVPFTASLDLVSSAEYSFERRLTHLNQKEWQIVFAKPQRKKDVEGIKTMIVNSEDEDVLEQETVWVYKYRPEFANYRSFVKASVFFF